MRVRSRQRPDATVEWVESCPFAGTVIAREGGVHRMTSPTEELFAQLGRRGHEPLLAKASGTVRFEIAQGMCTEHWYVRVDRGDVTVSRENLEADAVVRASRELFDRVADGEEYILAALLRGEMSAEGRIPLLVLFERLLPGPEASPGRRLATSVEGRLLFSFDTRYLSTWVLTVDGERVSPLSTDDTQYFEKRFFLVTGPGGVYANARASVLRERKVTADGLCEELTVLNHDPKPVDLTVRVEAACDFADLFEVKNSLAKKGSYYTRVEDGRLVLGYTRDSFRQQTTVSATAPAHVDPRR